MLYKDPSRKIEGWLHPVCGAAIYSLLHIQREKGITGNSLEIGVYLGKTMSHFICDRNKNEVTIGIDPFVYSFQPKGLKNKDILKQLLANIKKLNQEHHINGKTILLKGYSHEDNIINAITKYKNTFRVISIDGGHGYKEVMNDLCLASTVSADNGVIIVDDYCNPICPDVTNAIKDFLIHNTKGRSWRITFGIIPDCSPLTGSTRIFLQRKKCQIDYGKMISEALNIITFQYEPKILSDYVHLGVDIFESNTHIFTPKE